MQLIQYLPDPMRPESPPIDEEVQSTIEDALRGSYVLKLTDASSTLGSHESSLEPDLAQQFALEMEDGFRLVIRINRPLAEALFNRPIGREQNLEPDSDKPGHYIVTTFVDNSPQLRRWLARRNGSELEILEPGGLV